MPAMEQGPALQQIAGAANLALAVSIIALTVARQTGASRPRYTRSWAFFGLAAVTLLMHAAFDLAGPAMSDLSRMAEVATTALLSVAFVFLYGADREGIDRIQDAAERDALTNLFRRTAFEMIAKERLERTVLNDGHAAVAILDLDGFKKVNDTLGHQAGDRVLQLAATAIRANLRPHDIAARWGGDEFVILLDRCQIDEAARVCDRIVRSIGMLSLANGAQVTFSCGLAVAPDHGTDLRDLVHRADEELLGVKRAGKNAVRVAAVS